VNTTVQQRTTEHQDLRFLSLSRARHVRVIARPVMDDWSGGAGALRRVRDEWRYVKDSGLKRYGRSQVPPPLLPDQEPSRELPTGVFAGYLYDHYGHFLLESLARLWAPPLAAPAPLIWIAGWADTLSPWMHDVLDLLEVPGQRVVVTARSGPIEVDELAFPEPGFEFGRHFHPWLARRLGVVEHDSRRAHAHVWLSRSSLVPASGLDEEVELETALASDGWTVIHPEQLTIAEQVAAMAAAVHVAGLEGSAFHTLLLLRSFRGLVEVFTRHDHCNFDLAAAAAGHRQVRRRLPGAVPRERAKHRGTDVQWSGVDIEATCRRLRASCAEDHHAPPDGGMS
jgi:capsular polysaccharide biosynthesis protein